MDARFTCLKSRHRLRLNRWKRCYGYSSYSYFVDAHTVWDKLIILRKSQSYHTCFEKKLPQGSPDINPPGGPRTTYSEPLSNEYRRVTQKREVPIVETACGVLLQKFIVLVEKNRQSRRGSLLAFRSFTCRKMVSRGNFTPWRHLFKIVLLFIDPNDGLVDLLTLKSDECEKLECFGFLKYRFWFI